jgi:hypothetical protein
MARIELGIDKKTGEPAWAEISDPEDLTARQRREVRDVIRVPFQIGGGMGTAEVGGGIMDTIRARMVAQVTTAWSFPEPITAETVEDLPARMFDVLVEATEPHWDAANFRPTTAPSSE